MRHFLYWVILMLPGFAFATNLKISTPTLYIDSNQAYAVFNVSWENSWNNSKNHDAAWIFLKAVSNEGQKHIKILQNGHEILWKSDKTTAHLNMDTSADGTGFYIQPKNAYRGTINARIKVHLDKNSVDNLPRRFFLKAFGLEMVYIPKAPFQIGTNNQIAQEHGAFYHPTTKGAIAINSEDQIIKVSPNGDLFYTSGRELYEGDQQGTIPASYPKGVNPFYIMKYELNDGQYVDFLNSLTAEEQNVRTLLEKENYHEQGGTIAYQEGIYTSEIPQKPCRFASWDDAMAFADWAGLRPMTELEYTKANRGTLAESESTFPWGNQPKTTVQRLPDAIGTLNMANQWNENDLNDDNKHIFGASYYWVMDLSGSVWERVVTVGHEKGRNFKGSHGDGILDESGYANAPDWPSGGDDGGVGFRGGGFYGYDRSYTLFNPFSPIAFRKYGGWHGTMRSIAYGTRFVRSTKN